MLLIGKIKNSQYQISGLFQSFNHIDLLRNPVFRDFSASKQVCQKCFIHHTSVSSVLIIA